MDTAINKAEERLNFVSQDKEFLRNYHLREMAMSDLTTAVNTGFERGFEKGVEKNKFEIAKNMLHEGMSLEIIQKVTGLDAETIQSLI